MYLSSIKLTNFRNYAKATAAFPPGISIILGGNGAGKTSLLEASQYALCGKSFRTSRDAELVSRGEGYFRIEAGIEQVGVRCRRVVGYEPGAGSKVDPGGGAYWYSSGSVIIFSPDEMHLIKGPPAVRRRFLDDTIVKRSPGGDRLVSDYAKVLAQRNSFLERARSGIARLEDISPWDRQLAQLALKIFTLRREGVRALSPLLGRASKVLAGEEMDAGIEYRSRVAEFFNERDPEAAMVSALAESWSKDMERLSTSVGIHRDDVEFYREGRDLRLYGSQGEQRVALLALLASCREAAQGAGPRGKTASPILFLDDVMSELDPGHRRRLMRMLKEGLSANSAAGCWGGQAGGAGSGQEYPGRFGRLPSQVIITAADKSLFTEEELAGAALLRVGGGEVSPVIAPAEL